MALIYGNVKNRLCFGIYPTKIITTYYYMNHVKQRAVYYALTNYCKG